MPLPFLIRDVMRIGVPTCKLADTIAHVAALMIDGGHTAVIVLDEEADTRVDQRACLGLGLCACGGSLGGPVSAYGAGCEGRGCAGVCI